MDELRKKRESLADPKRQIDRIDHDDYKTISKEKLQELKSDFSFEKKLQESFDIDVPEQLADKILLKQHSSSIENNPLLKPTSLLAATITLTMALFFFSRSPNLSSIALKHVYHELDHLIEQDFVIDRRELIQQMEQLGLVLEQLPNRLRYAGKCKLNGQLGLHLVAEVNNRPVTLLMTPEQSGADSKFQDDRFSGKILKRDHSSLIIIGESLEDVNRILSQTLSGPRIPKK